ncbi:unnamed protein product [Caenorhabditis angaria]|uniref:LITAF domain-containing protein n=1 Tax=Caenorhabditis angaria TaxID=860376 RepID=A0A9P1IJQ7_9PELO|nr:unnamed protein product [Caenorhabditis angaria]
MGHCHDDPCLNQPPPMYTVQPAATVVPPPGTVIYGAQPPTVQVGQGVYVNQGYVPGGATIVQPAVVATPVTVVTVAVKPTDHLEPYSEYCPRCQTQVMTRVQFSPGACWWAICIIGFFFICWPILFFLCCNVSKNANHYCPNCACLIAVRKRGC